MSLRKITVFEHQSLEVIEGALSQVHFNALVRFNDKHGQKYFKIGYQKVIFNAYVGVIQLGDLIIEILPKGDQLPESSVSLKWQRALLTMLRFAGKLRLNATENASQAVQNYHVLDLILFEFLAQTRKLIDQGLVKRYRLHIGNSSTLKGKLLIQQQLTVNLAHRERFFTEHHVYDQDNNLNRILKLAVRIILQNTKNAGLKREAFEAYSHFEQVRDIYQLSGEAGPISYTRKTEGYRQAIELALLIIRQHMPALRYGGMAVTALLLNMNRLFEQFIYQLLKREEKSFADLELEVREQLPIPFWQDQHIKADVLLEYIHKKKVCRIVIDTKWKRLLDERPADEDLKQMFTYNFQYGSVHAILLYPFVTRAGTGRHAYHPSLHFKEHEHSCEVHFANLFDAQGQLNAAWAAGFLKELLPGAQESPISQS